MNEHNEQRPSGRSHGRRLAVGDIHGCSSTLRKMVEEVVVLTKDDTLFLLGDYIDRGPRSKSVLDYMLSLLESGYDLRPLLGNHEEMLLDAASGNVEARMLWFGNGGLTTLDQFRVQLPEEIPKAYIDFLSGMPRLIIEDDYILAHAGLDWRKEDPIHQTSSHDLLWIRDGRPDLQKLCGKTLVCGHTMTMLFEIKNSVDKSIICLDNGCYSQGEVGFGALVAMDLDSKQLFVQVNCDEGGHLSDLPANEVSLREGGAG